MGRPFGARAFVHTDRHGRHGARALPCRRANSQSPPCCISAFAFRPGRTGQRLGLSQRPCPGNSRLCRPCHRLPSRSLWAAGALWTLRPAAGHRPRTRPFMSLARTTTLKPLPFTGVGGTTSGCCLPVALQAMPHALMKSIGAIALTIAGRATSGSRGARRVRLAKHFHALSACQPPCHSPAGQCVLQPALRLPGTLKPVAWGGWHVRGTSATSDAFAVVCPVRRVCALTTQPAAALLTPAFK